MALFAIGDLHLGFAKEKSMEKFGEVWKNHSQKLEQNWKKYITQQDTILLLGDISWAMKLEEAKTDLDFIAALPGKKICICGNHDYWWSSVSKLQKNYENILFLRNNSIAYQKAFICGTRGWICPNDSFFTPQDQKIYQREVGRLRLSLEHAKNAGAKQMIVLLHFPPTNDKKEESELTRLLQQYPVTHVLYGHLHGENFWQNSLLGSHKGIFYDLVSGDRLNFCPQKIELLSVS